MQQNLAPRVGAKDTIDGQANSIQRCKFSHFAAIPTAQPYVPLTDPLRTLAEAATTRTHAAPPPPPTVNETLLLFALGKNGLRSGKQRSVVPLGFVLLL